MANHNKEDLMMDNENEMIPKEEALRQINLALRRTAMLYHAFGDTLIAALGRERGMALIKKAVYAYGADIGLAAKDKAEKKKVALTPDNFQSDLPSMAWKTEEVEVKGEKRTRVHFCPIAKDLLDMEEAERARLYCWVDQAKTSAFNPEFEFLHLKNVIDGDPYCEMVIRPAGEKEPSG
jgi:hypothetical protein